MVLSVPSHEETTMYSLVTRKTPIVRSVRRPKQHESGVESKQTSAWTGLHFLLIRRLGNGRSQDSEREKRVEMWTQNRSYRAMKFHELDPE